MASSDELKIGDRVRMHPEWIQNCIDFLGLDSLSPDDYTMIGIIVSPGDNDTDAIVRWDGGSIESVSPCNLLKIKEE